MIARPIGDALQRARWPIASVAVAYALSVVVGIAMVRTGNEFALDTRDAIVGDAIATDPATRALGRGEVGTAAIIDFARNVSLGAVPTTLAGLAVIMPYPIVAYRGWVGGIVSSRADRSSRLDEPEAAGYYLAVIVLQLLPYSLPAGPAWPWDLRFSGLAMRDRCESWGSRERSSRMSAGSTPWRSRCSSSPRWSSSSPPDPPPCHRPGCVTHHGRDICTAPNLDELGAWLELP